MKTVCILAAAMLFIAPAAMACDIPPPRRDEHGNIIPPPPPDPILVAQRQDRDVAAARISFVGNVVAYRTISGTLIEGNPRWTDEDPILSWVFQIEHAIEGIESETMFFEELY